MNHGHSPRFSRRLPLTPRLHTIRITWTSTLPTPMPQPAFSTRDNTSDLAITRRGTAAWPLIAPSTGRAHRSTCIPYSVQLFPQAMRPQYWQGASFHVYPIFSSTISTSDEEKTLNGVLAHGTTDWYNSYIQPLIGQNTPVFISEVNSGSSTMAFNPYIYNGIFLAEFVARMSTIPQVKALGVATLFLPNSFTQGIIRAVNDYQSYLQAQVKANPNYSTDTSTNPNTQYSFYYSTNALALEVTNLAVNGS